jgi:hypothetical protein
MFFTVLAGITCASLAAHPAEASPTLVQHTSKDAGTTLSASLAFPLNNTTGNWIGVAIRAGHSGQVFTVTDARGNNYRQAVVFNQTLDTPNGDTFAIFYAENISGGANTITVSESLSNSSLRFAILEYSGLAVANSLEVQGVTAAQGTGTSASSGNITTTGAGDLLLGVVMTGNGTTYAAGSGFTIEEQVPTAPNTKLIAEDQVQAAAGTVAASATFAASMSWGAALAAFKSASGTVAAPPNITNLNPTSGSVGTTVTLMGTNFGATQGASTVTFNGTPAGNANNWSATSITVLVPAGATSGPVVVTVAGMTSNSVGFTVTPPPPSITSLSPTSGPVGTSVTLTGTNFGSGQGASTVTFNGTPAGTANNWSATSITVPVPAGATSGLVVVTVGGMTSNGVAFTVVGPPPNITSLSPVLGTVGTTVTIAGANFGAAQGASTVTFHGTPAGTANNWSATSITVPVPMGATTGNIVVNIGSQASNGANFTVQTAVRPLALVQQRSVDAGTTNSFTLAFGSSNTPGNWIAVAIRAGHSGQIFNVSDSRGNTYHQAVQSNITVDTPNGDTLGIFYAENIAGGANAVAVSDSIASSTLRFAILEYSGLATSNSLDVVAVAQGTGTVPDSGNATTTATGDLLFGAILASDARDFTAGAGYIIRDAVPALPNSKLIAEDQVQSVAGSVSASASLSASAKWGAALAAFKAATGGGSTSPTITSLNPTSGLIGEQVTITGTNFGANKGSSTVAFNGTTANPKSWSATNIVVFVPAGASTGVVVVNVGGMGSNGVTFTVKPPPPSIASLNPGSAVTGNGPFTLTVAGTNFVSSSTVQWNGSPRTTTFVSSTQLQATITAADISTVGLAKITVANPGPYGSVSAGSTFFVGTTGGSNFAVITVDQAAQDIAYDPKNQVIYLSVPGTAASNPNTICVLDPATGMITSAQPAGSNPNALAISDDSQFLYAGIDGAASVQRFLLPGLAKDISYSLGTNPNFGPYFALDLQVAPGAPHTTAVSLGNAGLSAKAQGGITVFDDATPRPTNAPGGFSLYDSIQWGADATTLFAANTESTGFDFYTLSVNSGGVTQNQDFQSVFGSFANRIHFDAGTKLIYADEGHVINPATGLPVGDFNDVGPMVVDSILNIAFFVSGQVPATIQAFDLAHFTPIDSITIPTVGDPASRLIRWGQNGLAFITKSVNGVGKVFLVGGNFISPAPPFALTPPPTPTVPPTPPTNAPTIASLNPSSAIAGGGAFTLTIIGTQFDPTATAQFNGSALPTTFVSSTQLQAAVSASDIASPGTASITVANPPSNGGTSSGAAFFIGNTGGISSSGTTFAVDILNQASKDIVFDPADQLIYLSVPNTSANGNAIAVLDPATIRITGEQFAGSNPNVIAISDDAQFLYAGIDGSSSVQRFTLPGLGTDISYSLGAGSYNVGPYFALDLQVAPGSPHTTAVSRGAWGTSPAALGGIEIFDDITMRPTFAKGFGPGGGGGVLYDSIQWGSDASTLFAANSEDTGYDFYALSVNSSGVVLTNDYPNTFSSFTNRIHFDSGTKLIYADDGHVIDPKTGLAVGNFGVWGPMVPDSTLNRAFFIKVAGNSTVVIYSFDLTHFTSVSSISIPNIAGKPLRLIRWGQNGLAFNTDAGEIALVGGNFVH